MARCRPVTERLLAETPTLREQYEAGATISALARRYGHKRETVHRVLAEQGAPLRGLGRPPKSRIPWLAEDRGHETPCHIWQRGMANGYAILGDGRLAAHAAWESAHGPLPARTVVRRACGQGACVRLEHLALDLSRADESHPLRHDAWLAGFAAGEGCFHITPKSGGHRPVFALALRDDDVAILADLQTAFGGTVRRIAGRGTDRPKADWRVYRKDELLGLVAYFDRFPLRAKKADDFAVWRQAVVAYATRDGALIPVLRNELQQCRKYEVSTS